MSLYINTFDFKYEYYKSMKLDRVFSNMNRYNIGIFIIIHRCLNKDNENMSGTFLPLGRASPTR